MSTPPRTRSSNPKLGSSGRAPAGSGPAPAAQELEKTRDDDSELSASVERGVKSEAVLTVLRGENPGALYTIESNEAVIGRSPDATVMIPDDTLSRRHARIVRIGEGFVIEDLESTNGTFIDGSAVSRLQALEDGCRIFLGSKTVLLFKLHDRVELEAARQTQAMTVRDPLTGMFNRRHLQERLQSEVAYARRHGTPLSLLLLDIDHFKQINDNYGHPAGDAALRVLAQALTALTREEDVLARYGGEEFALLARGIDRGGILLLAERIRSAIAAERVKTEAGSFAFTVSIGITHSQDGADVTAESMFESADRALYTAKDSGRNVVSIAPPAA
jgi:diguanylate cyclase (GGDEF)-like protein